MVVLEVEVKLVYIEETKVSRRRTPIPFAYNNNIYPLFGLTLLF